MSSRFRRVLELGLATLLVLSACGGDDASDDTGNDGTVAQTGTTVVPTAIPNIPGLSDECVAVANVMLAATQSFTGSVENVDAAFAAAEARIPNDLRDDIAVIRGAVQEFADAVEELGINPFLDPTAFSDMTPEDLEVFEELGGILDRAEVSDAFDAVSDWGEAECDEFSPGG